MATVYKIHPAIGIARVGNSAGEFFIGPERRGELPEPQGGFKDAQCRVKRQAARFRIFAHHDDGTVEEITDAEADITWTVHLANRKAAYPGRGNSEPASDLVIDPGARTTNGPNQQKLFDTGKIKFSGQSAVTVPLGEMRSDTENRLLVLGGFGKAASPAGNGIGSFWGNPGWYDDVADGPVSATIRIRATNATPPVLGAWVIVAPPKFAPHQDSVTTLWDRVLQAMVSGGLTTAPTTTSYTEDVYPILQRARDIKWVFNTWAHSWADPVTGQAQKDAIFARLDPPGNMPDLLGSDRALTSIQYAHMQRWKDGTFNNDWPGNPPGAEATVAPGGMDRAALDACVGAAFFPGIEAGGKDSANRPILNAANYAEAFRIDHATVPAGTISASMALPWQADFYACGSRWWPVPRPNQVKPQGSSGYLSWDRSVNSYADMVANWASLGFVVKQGAQHVEVERCDTATITLLTPYLHFIDVPQGPMGMVREVPLAISFEVISPSTAVTLEYAPGGAPSHAQLVAHNSSVSVGPTGSSAVATAQLWIIYRTGAAASSIPTQTVTVREPVSGQTWDITIDANTVARKTAAVALVLDRSGSMSDDRGDGVSKHVALQQAAQTFVDVMLEGDGVGLVRYNQDAQPLQTVKLLGNGMLSDTNRTDTVNLILGNSFDPSGATSIGDGIYEGRQLLNTATGTYDTKALVVLTDGIENRSRWIADVAPEIDEKTYAVGLGTPQNTSAPALQTISGNNGGFLLVTGAISGNNRFLLQKYFLQILAGVSNAEIVLDPDGELVPGAVHRIPFRLTEADAGVDVILLSPYAKAVDYRLQTPTGLILEPWRAMSEPGMRWTLSNGVSYYRIALPTQLIADRYDQAGTWHALLTIGSPRTQPSRDDPEQRIDRSILRGLHTTAAARQRMERAIEPRSEEQRRFALASGASSLASAAARTAAAGVIGASTHETGSGARRTLPYSLIVHSYSNLALHAELKQSSWEPGTRVSLNATIAQSGLALEAAATVWAEWTRPDGSQGTVPLARTEPGKFSGEFVAAQVGVHRLRVRASGQTRNGLPFSRERTLTAAVWHGGDRGGRGGADDRLIDELRQRDERLCKLLDCLLSRGGVIEPELEKRLRAAGIDLDHLRKCLATHCKPSSKVASSDDR